MKKSPSLGIGEQRVVYKTHFRARITTGHGNRRAVRSTGRLNSCLIYFGALQAYSAEEASEDPVKQ